LRSDQLQIGHSPGFQYSLQIFSRGSIFSFLGSGVCDLLIIELKHTHCFALTMERLFSSCTRYEDILNSLRPLGGELRDPRETFQELDLDVSIEELLSAERAFTYGDLYAMLGNENTIAWLTPHAAVAVARTSATAWGRSCRFCFSADGQEIVAFSRYAHLLEICDVVLRLLAASVVHSVILVDGGVGRFGEFLINAPTVGYLMEQCQSLKSLKLMNLRLDENHCRVLGGCSRPGLEIEVSGCKLKNAGASAFVEVLGRNEGPTKLDDCYIDNSVLANGLRGNNRLKRFRPRILGDLEVIKRDVLAIADALKENKGLLELDLGTWCFRENDETWGAICDSLKTHPTLEVLNLISGSTDAAMAPEVITSRIQALLDMVKVNLSIHTINLVDPYSKHELFHGAVIPYLETNMLRPRLLAIQKTRRIPYRTKVLGRALLAARSDANSFWMLLSGNAEVAFPSTAATTTLAANLPTPGTTAATSTSNGAATTSAATPPDSALGVSDPTVAVAANVAILSAGQKRKARL
jgi:hypothetical protein